MKTLENKIVIVAGGTGNVGAFLARGLLAQGATVVVPSRSETKLTELRAHLRLHVKTAELDRLRTVLGDLTPEASGETLVRKIGKDVGPPDAVIASLGRFRPSPSLLAATEAELDQVVRDYLYAHFAVARRFLSDLKARGGAHVFVNGPLAWEPREGSGLVSIATAGQHMLFRSLARELEGTRVRIMELVNYAFIRDRQTQPTSALPGEAVGAYAAYLVSDAAAHLAGQSIHLRSVELLERAGIPAVG